MWYIMVVLPPSYKFYIFYFNFVVIHTFFFKKKKKDFQRDCCDILSMCVCLQSGFCFFVFVFLNLQQCYEASKLHNTEQLQ